MKSTEKQLDRSAHSWINKVERRHPHNVDYDSELRDWLQHVILEAEKNNNFKKRTQFLSFLEDLSAI